MIHHSLDVSVPRLIWTAAAMLAGIGLDLLYVPATQHRPAGKPA